MGLTSPATPALPSPTGVAEGVEVADRGTGGSSPHGADWFGATKRIRGRILGLYVLLLILAGVLSTFAIHQVLMIRLDHRIEDALRQEVLELDRLVQDGRDPATGEPFVSLENFFDVYFVRNVPSSEEALFAFVGGRLYRSVTTRFPIDRLPADMIERFASASAQTGAPGPAIGQFDTELGTGYFRALPVQIGQGSGTFVIAILPLRELAEISELQFYAAAAIVGVLLLAMAGAWWLVGRMLVPVRVLTDTARLISESELTRRIPVYGDDEAAEMARTFNAMLDRLETVLRSERDFIRDASHQLRVPLTICLGNLGLLEDGVLDDQPLERSQTIALVSDELERMGRIVEDLQLLADAEDPGFLQPEPIDLAAFTSELAAKATALAPRRWEVDHAASGTVVVDRHRLTEAVMNLADNAAQHTSPDETVAIGSAVEDDGVRLWVRDTGSGIGVADQARIFDRFRRGADAYRRYRGTGLGLAIVRKIAEVHGGRVELESQVGVGSTFSILLPARLWTGGTGAKDPDR